MINQKIRQKYLPTIGIECHVQLKTKTKLFAAVDNDARQSSPNTLISHICLGLPGALPVLNEEAVVLAVKAAYALNSKPQLFSKFDRKHYFYPDLPMGYQITQYDQPIILGGSVNIKVDTQIKTIGITRAHLEADAGKSVHPAGANYSLVDLNRAGTPLLEIVSQPDMHSALEAKAYARELYLIMRYAAVSEADLYYGNMRFDVNVSVSQDQVLGIRSETKNLNSFKSVERACQYEIDRQINLLEKGEVVKQETRGWDEAKQKTISQRSKENADDYRYMPEPDLPPLALNSTYISKIKNSMPALPSEWRRRLKNLELDESYIENLLEAQADQPKYNYLSLIESYLNDKNFARFIANWLVNLEIPLRRDNTLSLPLDQRAKAYLAVYKLFQAKQINSTNLKILLTELMNLKKLPSNIKVYAQTKSLIQQSDTKLLEDVIRRVLTDNPKAVDDLKAGQEKVIGFLVGQVMQATKGQANPAYAKTIIKKLSGL